MCVRNGEWKEKEKGDQKTEDLRMIGGDQRKSEEERLRRRQTKRREGNDASWRSFLKKKDGIWSQHVSNEYEADTCTGEEELLYIV